MSPFILEDDVTKYERKCGKMEDAGCSAEPSAGDWKAYMEYRCVTLR